MTKHLKFKCKEQKCGKEIVFKDDPVIAVLAESSKSEIDEDEIIYLTCADGHTHPYAFSERI